MCRCMWMRIGTGMGMMGVNWKVNAVVDVDGEIEMDADVNEDVSA